MNESQMASEFVSHESDHNEIVDVEYEVPYNHYGSRGFIDVVLDVDYYEGKRYLGVVELKSESATKGVTGPNEILRQFKKHREYFLEGQEKYSNTPRYEHIEYRLIFYATEYTLNHVRQNIDVYKSIVGTPPKATAVQLFHEDIGTVSAIYGESAWKKDTRAKKLREVVL